MDITKPRNNHSWRRPRTLWIVAGGILTLILLVALLRMDPAAPAVAASEVWTGAATRGEMVREIRATGVLLPRDTRWISAGARATVQQRVVEPGARVEPDTVILHLANPELEAGLERAQAALAGAEAEVAAARTSLQSQLLDQRAQLAQAEAEWRSAEVRAQAHARAHAAGVLATIELRQSEINEEQTRNRAGIERQRVDAFRQNMAAQLSAARARRDEAASALEIARQQLDAMQVRAGIDGILQQVEVEPGQQVEMGAALARVARPDDLIARLQVPEVLAKDLMLELPVAIDTRNGVVEGTVSRIDPAVRNGSVAVDAVFTGKLPPGARPDLSVEGRILLGRLENVVSIARPPLAAPDSASTLFVLDPASGIARRTPVRYGVASSDRIEVAEGLRDGDRAILSDTSRWDSHDVLRLR
ncbi:HlyD family efflux transporter periplasmic adaptor subunit [Lysobacter sp. GX 14042]|uniref:efflux RND transporter periplasmic adaptor subunit n=1 Tax=Lysobacter sp. GX 14042 TaxID=2907155 RepID=UPI001F3096C0|nr:HlyD family efflux transporter periplasmic adaptor subunit [Lysobacter sp. GX 14042]MCE7031485.1 HlyD family efflux transporter periplasmic adaptor subunit [Lysobacter sp. GX 14042]